MKNLKVIIKVTTHSDLEHIERLWNNGHVKKFVGFPNGLGITIDKLQEWIKRAIKPPYRCHYSIYLENGTYCGETFYDVDIDTRIDVFDIKLMPSAGGKGIALKALSYYS